MPQPTPYNRQNSFALYSARNPNSPPNGVTLDTEFNAVKVALDETQANLALIQDDDGRLARASVGRDQLDSSITIGFESPTPWVTGHDYSEGVSTVFQEAIFYTCTETHTSGNFATDLAAGKWLLVADLSAAAALPDGGVTEAKLADGAVTSTKLATNAVGTSKLASSAVSTPKIQNEAVSADKLAADAVVTVKILDANVTTPKIADSNVTTPKIADDAITLAKLVNAPAQNIILARKSALEGDYEPCTFTEVLDMVTGATRGDILVRGALAWDRLARGTQGQVLRSNGTDTAFGAIPLLHVREEQTSGTSSTAPTTLSTWNTKILNTTKTNEINSASVSSNQISLPAGTYEIDAVVPYLMSASAGASQAKARLQDITNGNTILYGPTAAVAASGGGQVVGQGVNVMRGRFTLSATTTIAIQQYQNLTAVAVAAMSQGTEVYTDVMIRRVA